MIHHSKVKAFGPQVLVEVEPAPEKTKGGIYRPQGNSEDRVGYCIGRVVSVGEGYFNQSRKGKPPKEKFSPIRVKVGDRIMFRGYLHDVSRYHQGIEGLKHSLVHANDIEGILEE